MRWCPCYGNLNYVPHQEPRLLEAGASSPVAATAPRLDTDSFHAAARAIAMRGLDAAQTTAAIRDLFHSSLSSSFPPPPTTPPPPSSSTPLPPVPPFRPPPPPPASPLPQPDTTAPKMRPCHRRGFHESWLFLRSDFSCFTTPANQGDIEGNPKTDPNPEALDPEP